MDNFSNKYNEIHFIDDSDPNSIQIDLICSVNYLTEEIIIVLFKTDNKLFIMEYNIIEKKRLSIKSKIIDIKVFSAEINTNLDYVIIIPDIEFIPHISKFSNSAINHKHKKVYAQIIIWEIKTNKSFYFNVDTMYHISLCLNIDSYIIINDKQGIIYIYDINDFLIKIDKISQSDNIYNEFITIKKKNKKSINLKKYKGQYKNTYLREENDEIILIDYSKKALNSFPHIFILIFNKLLTYKFINDGYNIINILPLENLHQFAICSIIIDNNKLFLLESYTDITVFKCYLLNKPNNLHYSYYSYNIKINGYPNFYNILILDNNENILIVEKNTGKLIFIKNNKPYKKIETNIDIYYCEFNPTTKNILILDNKNSLYEFKYTTIYPLIDSEVFKIANNKNKILYINNILSNFDSFKNYIISNNLLKKGLNENDFKMFNYNDIFKNIKNFINIIFKYIQSLPNNNNNRNNDMQNRLKTYRNALLNNQQNNLNNIPNEKFKNYQIEEIYKKFIYNYLYYLSNLFKKVNRNNYREKQVIINSDHEISDILRYIKHENIKKIRVSYVGNPAANAGGVSRSFFTKLEELLNNKFYLQRKIKLLRENRKKINNSITSQLTRSSKTREEIEAIRKSNYNIINRNIQNISLQLNQNIAKNIDSGLENNYKVFDILALSKINNNPIYYEDDKFKNILLIEILKEYKDKNIKNILYNLLIINENNIINAEYLKDITINLENNIKNNSNEKFLANFSQPMTIIDHIKNYIIKKYYLNLLDIYISHFINFNINIDSLKKKITFNTYGHDEDENFKRFINKFLKCLELLDQTNLRNFNRAITGSRLEKDYYTITLRIIDSNNQIKRAKKLEPEFYTCFNTMHIDNMEDFEKIYLEFNSSNVYNSNTRNDNSNKRLIDLWIKYANLYTIS
jgi:hypothetical protein